METKSVSASLVVLISTLVLPGMVMAKEPGGAAATKGKGQQSDWSWSAEAGLGYDTNVYRSHQGSYINYYPAVPTTVNPKVQSGFFVPFKGKIDFSADIRQDMKMLAEGKLNGDFYVNPSLRNANNYETEGRVGLNKEFARNGKHMDDIYAGVMIGHHQQTYTERATGAQKLSAGGADISNRYTYDAIAMEGKFRKHTGDKIRWGLNATLEDRTYSDPVAVAKYDHMLTVLGGDVEYVIQKGNLLKMEYAYEVRDFSARSARDLNGTYAAANGKLKYIDHNIRFYARQHLSEPLVAYFDLGLVNHSDTFVNYTGYNEFEYGIRVRYSPEENWNARLALSKWSRNYSHAFAYDNPTQPRLTTNGLSASLKGEYALTKKQALWAELEHREWNTNDLRFDYKRWQLMVGAKVEY